MLSVLDIVSDIILFFDYLHLGREKIKEYVLLNDTSAMEDQTNWDIGNITVRSCTIINTTCSEEGLMISCKIRKPWCAIGTLSFIYLPACTVIATLYGPKKAGMVVSVGSLFMLIPGGTILLYIGYSLTSPAAAIVGWTIILLGLVPGVFSFFVFGF